ncbi:hypothetical protein, partial [Mesorhizobium sp.]
MAAGSIITQGTAKLATARSPKGLSEDRFGSPRRQDHRRRSALDFLDAAVTGSAGRATMVGCQSKRPAGEEPSG